MAKMDVCMMHQSSSSWQNCGRVFVDIIRVLSHYRVSHLVDNLPDETPLRWTGGRVFVDIIRVLFYYVLR